jgi:hypothetical protein
MKLSRRAAQGDAMPRVIDPRFKGLLTALEPPPDNKPEHLLPEFWGKLNAALAALAAAGTPFKFVEGFRTLERQRWLYGSGRPGVEPYGRPGKQVTPDDGVTNRSKHQGDGSPGSGRAADCYPTRNGRVFIPDAGDPIWRAYADAVIAHGLRAGLNFKRIDAPHCELP